MNSASHSDLDLEFKIPTEADMIAERNRSPLKLSADKYFEFVELGIRMCPDLKKARALKHRAGLKVRFEL